MIQLIKKKRPNEIQLTSKYSTVNMSTIAAYTKAGTTMNSRGRSPISAIEQTLDEVLVREITRLARNHEGTREPRENLRIGPREARGASRGSTRYKETS